MRRNLRRSSILVCYLALFLACLYRPVHAQAPGGIPAEWLAPIGGGGGAAPATGVEAGAQPTTTPDPNAGAGTITQPISDPNATPIADPNAIPVADPNAAAGGAPLTPTTDTPAMTTDPNAAAGGATPTMTPTPTTTGLPSFDPLAGIIGGGSDATVAAPPQGALVGGAAPVPQVAPTQPQEQPSPSPIPDNGPIPEDTLPPGPPMDWKALPIDTAIIFGMKLEGPYLTPWTKSKSWVFTTVLADRYLRSIDKNDIETGPLETYQYNEQPGADSSDGSSNKRRKLHVEIIKVSRKMLQDPVPSDAPAQVVTGVHLRVVAKTNSIRVESEVRTVADAVSDGSLAKDLSMSLGSPVDNITLTQQPTTVPYDKIPDPNANSGGSLPGWIIGTMVGAVLVLLPIPAYIMFKRHKRKHLEALEKQQAEAAAARQRMQSRILKAGGKSFSMAATPPRAHGDGLQSHDVYGGSMTTPRQGSFTPGSLSIPRSGSYIGGLNTPSQNGSRSPTRQMSVQHQLYQQQSLGPAMPSPNRSMSGVMRGAVYPIRGVNGSDEASTSSGSGRG